MSFDFDKDQLFSFESSARLRYTRTMKIRTSEFAPAAVGPYSHAVESCNLLFCSGQIPLDPATGKMAGDDIATQTEQVFANIRGLLKGLERELSDVVKTTIFLTDMGDFGTVNGIYADAFGDHKPARSTVAVAQLPLGAKIEIECIVESAG